MTCANPFARNLQNLTITRLLQISYEDDSLPCHRPLHASQASLTDVQVEGYRCAFNDDTVVVAKDQRIGFDLMQQHPFTGTVLQVIYSISGDLAGVNVHLADTFSPAQAQQLVDQLNVAASTTSEISDRHLDLDALQYLIRVTDETWYTGLAFEAFKLWKPDAIGIQLVTGYWSSLQEDFTSQDLYQEQLRNGVPKCLVDLLHLAAAASIRYVMFDPEAGQLDGLPVFERVELT